MSKSYHWTACFISPSFAALFLFVSAAQVAAQIDSTGLKIAELERLGINPSCIFDFRAQGIAELAEQRMQRDHLNNDRAYAAEAAYWIGTLKKQRVPSSQIRKVMCGDVAIGMTDQLVWLAKGTPLRTLSEETAGGVVEVRTFEGVAVTLSDKRVIKIRRAYH